MGNALLDQIIEQGQIKSLTLKNIVDPDLGQITTTTLIDGGNGAYPIFVDFTDASHTVIKIQPTSSTIAGTYLLSVQLSDGFATTTYNLNIVVEAVKLIQSKYIKTNQGPPRFISSLEALTLQIGVVKNYTLPPQIDPDEQDRIQITIELKEAIVLALYDTKTTTLTFNPKSESNYSNGYEIIITLMDNSINPEKTIYKLIVKIEQAAKIIYQIKNDTVGDLLTSKIANSKYQSSIKIVQVSRNGQLLLKIKSSQGFAARAIASVLNETDINVFVEDKSNCTTKIEEVLEGNILQIKLNFTNKQQISTSMVRFSVFKLQY
ncbi:hypothetical protein FGO68_gene15285 [Halteria grandinella]|uniref:Uncharacterized protein n=1 Tax=Halteria grandinella TaxID=5974 RepID=A0A8J8T948_HALGN|nr:hypothetical protein FGO68_gene15285 [Halteria grandinella]